MWQKLKKPLITIAIVFVAIYAVAIIVGLLRHPHGHEQTYAGQGGASNSAGYGQTAAPSGDASNQLAQLEAQKEQLNAELSQCLPVITGTAQGSYDYCVQMSAQWTQQLAQVEAQMARLQGQSGSLCDITGACNPPPSGGRVASPGSPSGDTSGGTASGGTNDSPPDFDRPVIREEGTWTGAAGTASTL